MKSMRTTISQNKFFLNFHIEIEASDKFFGILNTIKHFYLTDLNEVDVILYFVNPYFSKRPIIVRGEKIYSNQIKRIRIASTSYSLVATVNDWYNKNLRSFKPDDDPIWLFVTETNFFRRTQDRTPHFLMYYNGSPTQKTLNQLLEQVEILKKEHAESVAKENSTETTVELEDRLTKLMAKIAYVAGSYTRGFIEAG